MARPLSPATRARYERALATIRREVETTRTRREDAIKLGHAYEVSACNTYLHKLALRRVALERALAAHPAKENA